MTVQRATLETKSAPLVSDFAREFMTKRWGADIADVILIGMPSYKQGSRQGQRKGWLVWTKCTVGGWARVGNSLGGVMRPGSYNLRVGFGQHADLREGFSVDDLASRGDAESEEAYIARIVAAFTAWVGPAHEAHKRAQSEAFSPGRRWG